MIHHPITFHDYRALPGASNSTLKHIDRSPAHYKAALARTRVPTPAMTIGSLTDHLLFGTEFSYDVAPFPDFRSAAAKDWRDFRLARSIAIVKSDDVERVKTMVSSIRAHPAVAEIMQSGRSQVGIDGSVDIDDGTTVLCKGLVDWVSDTVAALVDLKTTDDASPMAFSKHIVNMGYDVQAALYTELWKLNTGEELPWVWVVVERGEEEDAETFTAVYVATPEILQRGMAVLRSRLLRLNIALTSNVWESYPDTVQPITLPLWALPKEQ